MSKAAYDAIAKDYQDSKQLPFRIYAEGPMLLKLLGDIRGLAILDLACGEGIYARRFKQLGAKHVLGVDISEEMIALARKAEQENPLGIEFLVGDALNLGKIGEYDVVVGSYLLNYARTPQELAAFCKTIAANLKPGGRFVGMNDNPGNDVAHYPAFRPYGFTKSSPIPRRDGSPVTYTFYPEDGSHFSFDNYYLAPAHYENAFAAAGLKNFQWHKPEVTPGGREKMGHDYWDLFEQDPPVVGLEARR